MKPRILLFIGPTAVGKSTLIERSLKDFPQLFDIITYTTRPMRQGESEGNPYHFVDEKRFKSLIDDGFFLEWAIVHGNMYGTPRRDIDETAKNGRIAIMDIDVQGAKKLREEYPQAVTVFLMPPSMDSLRQRFIKRGITNQEDLDRRLETAKREMTQAEDFDHQIVNDDFEETYTEVRKIIEKILKNQ